MPENGQAGRPAQLENFLSTRRFQLKAFDGETITTKAARGNHSIFTAIEFYSAYVRAKAVPNEREDIFSRTLVEHYILGFGPREFFCRLEVQT